VQEAPLAPAQRDILSQVPEVWFFERFRGLTAKEIWAMLNLMTPFQKTKACQSIFAKGEAKGKAEDLKLCATSPLGLVWQHKT